MRYQIYMHVYTCIYIYIYIHICIYISRCIRDVQMKSKFRRMKILTLTNTYIYIIYTQFIFCILYTIYHISYIIYYIYHIYGLFILCILHIYIYIRICVYPFCTCCHCMLCSHAPIAAACAGTSAAGPQSGVAAPCRCSADFFPENVPV